MKKLISIILAFCIVGVMFGCGKKGADKQGVDKNGEVTVVFIPKLTGSAFFDAANEGAQEYAENHGFKVEYKGNPEAAVDNQIAIINEAIESGADAICISSLDATALDGALKAAIAKGIKVTTWDSDVSGDARSVMVSQGTPSQLGQMLVEMSAKSLEERGKNPSGDAIKYAWHYSQASVTDQNSWRVAGEKYIAETYPNWINVAPDNYYSEQNPDKAVTVGESILAEHADVDLIICNDSTALPGQAQALINLGLTAQDVTVTGFAPPNAVREFCKQGIIARWGLWDCKVQGALGCYLAYYLASGNKLSVGDRIVVPDIGVVEVMPNTVLDPGAPSATESGVVLLPSRTEFTIDNVDDYNF